MLGLGNARLNQLETENRHLRAELLAQTQHAGAGRCAVMGSGTCPHCERDFARIDLHTVCVKEPAVHAWLAQNLSDPDAPRDIIPAYKFDQLNPPVSRRPARQSR